MKVLVFRGSPKKKKSNTDVILEPFMAGMKEAGAEVDLVNLRDLKINPCEGDFYCWYNNPGNCFQKDDMQDLYPKMRGADVWVLATPLYVDGMTGPLKNVIDRKIPLLEPFVEFRDGHTRKKVRDQSWKCKVVLVSNSGHWELDNFDALVHHAEAISKNMNATFAGSLLRPHGEILQALLKYGSSELDDVVEAAREAGRQLVEKGEMDEETLKRVSQQLVPKEKYVENANRFFQKILDKKNNTTKH